jgi:hypothetical protein
MTPYELALAQWLHGVWSNAQRQADRLDPARAGAERLRGIKGAILAHVEALSRTAGTAFHELTGRLPSEVDLLELHQRESAPWTRGVTHRLGAP